MDNADLEKLKFSAGTLSPAFHKNTTNYVVLLASSEDSVKLTVLTSDSGASYDLKVNAATCTCAVWFAKKKLES